MESLHPDMITVRPHDRGDVPLRVKWLNNRNANTYLVDEPEHVTTLEEQEDWFNRYEADDQKEFFTICVDTKPVGFMGLSHIDRAAKQASIFMVIGEDEYRGKGVGGFALRYLLRYGSRELGIGTFTLEVFPENIPAVRLYRSAGFQEKRAIDNMLHMELEFIPKT